jgi:hypothetical protein
MENGFLLSLKINHLYGVGGAVASTQAATYAKVVVKNLFSSKTYGRCDLGFGEFACERLL